MHTGITGQKEVIYTETLGCIDILPIYHSRSLPIYDAFSFRVATAVLFPYYIYYGKLPTMATLIEIWVIYRLRAVVLLAD